MKWFYVWLFAFGIAHAQPPEDYRLVWQDEFHSLEFGPGHWRDHFAVWNVRFLDGNGDKGFKLSDETKNRHGVGIGELLAATGLWGQGPYLHRIDDGKLTMRTFPNPDPASFGGLPYLASMISGQDLYAQHQGYWEVRFRLKALPQGHHLALWLLPDSYTWPPEIDLLEVVASEPGVVFANTHGLDASGISRFRPRRLGDWQVLGFEWSDVEMIWRLDGEEIRRQRASLPPETKFYFLASFEIGSRWPGEPSPDTSWPGQVEFDYLRIYQRTGP